MQQKMGKNCQAAWAAIRKYKKKKISQFKASISGLTVLEYIHVLNLIDLFLFSVCVR